MKPTPTPRTDERANSWESIDGQWVNAEFARWLERELASASDQLAANHEATKLMGKWLETERELADRLAETLRFINEKCDWNEGGDYGSVTYGDNRIGPACDKALAAWKEARRGTV